jgi:hypothetical protein
MTQTTPPFSAAADRNKHPILAELKMLLAPQGRALEIASGTGQHAVWFADALPGWTWQPTEADASALPGLAQQLAQARHGNVRAPVQLDVLAAEWPVEAACDLVFCANMLHIAPWATCAALMRGAARHLADDGQLVVYGPFLEDAIITAPGNLAFDQSLRERNPAWGIRQLEDVCEEAGRSGMVLRERHALPANNLLLVFARR